MARPKKSVTDPEITEVVENVVVETSPLPTKFNGKMKENSSIITSSVKEVDGTVYFQTAVGCGYSMSKAEYELL